MQRDIACWNRLIFITSFSLPFSFRRSSPRSSESFVHRRLIHPIFGADFRFPPRFTLIRVELGPTKASFFAISSGRRLTVWSGREESLDDDDDGTPFNPTRIAGFANGGGIGIGIKGR